MTSRTRLIVLLVTAPVLAFAVIGGCWARRWRRSESYQHLRVFDDVVSLISSNYVEEADMTKVMRGAMRGLAEGLDPDSAYLTPEEAKLHRERRQGRVPAETGIELTRSYYLRVIAARDGSPAAKAGLRPGDFLRAIDGKPTREMSVYEGMRAAARRAGDEGQPARHPRQRRRPAHRRDSTREVRVRPRRHRPPRRAGVGYVRIAAFGPNAASAVAAAGRGSLAQGRRLVAARRRAGHGHRRATRRASPSRSCSCRAARWRTRRCAARRGRRVAAAAATARIKLPTVVLVNDGTSGAAELFAAALAGNQRATLVGEHTQGAPRCRSSSASRRRRDVVSNGWYLTPAGRRRSTRRGSCPTSPSRRPTSSSARRRRPPT